MAAPNYGKLRYAALAALTLIVARHRVSIGDGSTFRADPVDLILIGVVIILEIAAAYLLKPKSKSLTQDDKPTTIATRGAYVPLVLGRRRVGCIFGWAGARFTRKESIGGGKGGIIGGGAPKQAVYYEAGWHQLCVGPGAKLHRITQNGKAVFIGPITPSSHPSGTAIDCGREGTFRIYWGEPDQPVDANLASALGGIESRWPYMMYVYWVEKRLGTAPAWPLLDYEVEVRPIDSQLVASTPWMEATQTPSGLTTPTYTSALEGHGTAAVLNGAARTCRFRFQSHAAYLFKPGSYARISGNAGLGGDVILRVWKAFDDGFDDPVTLVFFDEALSGATPSDGTLERFLVNEDDGANPAHILDQVMFQQYPHGRGLDRERYDMNSLEECGVVFAEEAAPAGMQASDGQNADAMVAAVMQDFGVLLSPDPRTGLIRFKLVRQPIDTPPNLTDDLIMEPVPEQGRLREDLPTDRMIYTFSDRDRNFKDNTITVDDDSQADLAGAPKSRTIQLTTVIDYVTASKVSERRSQETLTGQTKYRLFGKRGARFAMPGQSFTCDLFDKPLRVAGILRDPLTSKVTIDAMKDYYGAELSSFESENAGTEAEVTEPVEDLGYKLVELPAYLVTGKQMVVVIPRIRATAQTVRGDIYFSADDSTYVQVGQELDYQTGGALTSDMLEDDDWETDQGPTFTALGPDIGTVVDYTGDDTNWRLGRQVAVIDDEVFFLKKVTALGGSSYRLDGLIRARYDTSRAAHATGTAVYIFQIDSILQITDVLLQPGTTIFVKVQPATSESMALDSIRSTEVDLHGKGIVPMPIRGLRTEQGSDSYLTGDDVVHDWSYQSAETPGTGAGLQPAGGGHGAAALDGTFTVRVRSTSNVLKRTVTGLTSATYTYTDTDRTTDGLEGANYKIAVVNVSSGYESDEVEITVAHVT
jgi:hypothetical protein